MTASIGVSLYPEDGVDGETLVKNADIAMYRAKEQGRDNCQLYTPAMNDPAVERLAVETNLRRALVRDQLVPLPAPARPRHRPSPRGRGPRALAPARRRPGSGRAQEPRRAGGLMVPIVPWLCALPAVRSTTGTTKACAT